MHKCRWWKIAVLILAVLVIAGSLLIMTGMKNKRENHTAEQLKSGWLPKEQQLSDTSMRYKEIDSSLGFIGRWYEMDVNEKHCMVTNNCGSEVYFKTTGTEKIRVAWEPMTETNAYYAVIVDNGSPERKNILDQEIVLPDSRTHFVRIITDGITERIGKWEYGIGFALSEVTSDTGSITGVIPVNPLIMFFGDSITEGIRALGISDEDMGDTNSATGAFPWFCCENLGAVSYRAGYGASGILLDGSFQKAENTLRYYYSGKPVDEVQPDLIVINYGTNDYGLDPQEFIDEYCRFIDLLTEYYPGVKILAMIPFSQRMADEIRIVAADRPGVTAVETYSWEEILYTDGFHPSKEGAETAGKYLSDVIIDCIYGESETPETEQKE